MTHLKRIFLAIRALPTLAARLIVNLLPVLAVVGFAAALGACGGKAENGDDQYSAAVLLPVVVAGALISRSGGDSDNAPTTMTANPAPPMTMTTTMPTMTMTVTMPEPMEPAAPQPIAFDAPELAALQLIAIDSAVAGRNVWFAVFTLSAATQNTVLFGQEFVLQRQMVANQTHDDFFDLPVFNRTVFQETGNLVPLVNNGLTSTLSLMRQVAFLTRPTITAIVQLCTIPWIADHLRQSTTAFGINACPAMSGMSYSPDMRRVIYAAMADGFNRGVGIGESPFAFSGRYDGDNRAAGFTYDLGGYALRTDYIRLPSRQDSEVWLDTYRFGALTRLNDEARFFAGIDNYQNAILVMDTNGNNGKNLHRLGFAVGDGYAIKYEYRLNL